MKNERGKHAGRCWCIKTVLLIDFEQRLNRNLMKTCTIRRVIQKFMDTEVIGLIEKSECLGKQHKWCRIKKIINRTGTSHRRATRLHGLSELPTGRFDAPHSRWLSFQGLVDVFLWPESSAGWNRSAREGQYRPSYLTQNSWSTFDLAYFDHFSADLDGLIKNLD